MVQFRTRVSGRRARKYDGAMVAVVGNPQLIVTFSSQECNTHRPKNSGPISAKQLELAQHSHCQFGEI